MIPESSRPRIVVVAKFNAFRSTGSVLRLRSEISALSQLGDVTYIGVLPDDRNEPFGESIDGARAVRINYPGDLPKSRAVRNMVLERLPTHMAFQPLDQLRARVADIAGSVPDLVWVYPDRAAAMIPLEWWSHTRVVMDLIDYDVDLRRTFVLRSLSGLRRRVRSVLADVDGWLSRSQIRRVLRGGHLVVVSSELDAQRSRIPGIVAIPNTYPDQGLRTRVDTGVPTLLMVGFYPYGPNGDGLQWFVEQVFPLVRQQIPDVVLNVVGRQPQPVPAWTQADGVVVWGQVPDLEPHLATADVSVVPLRIGAGTRLKIVESFSMGIPVVSTTVGAEGIAVTPGHDILIADDPASFADAVVSLLRDPDRAQAQAAAARRTYESGYTYQVVHQRVRELMEPLLASRR